MINIFIGDVNDVEARVYARFVHGGNDGTTDGRVVLRGTLRGPFCENTRTLPAKFEFHNSSFDPTTLAEAVVTDPCTWSPELPHLYQADVEALQGDRIVAEFHGAIGLRRGSSGQKSDLFTGEAGL